MLSKEWQLQPQLAWGQGQQLQLALCWVSPRQPLHTSAGTAVGLLTVGRGTPTLTPLGQSSTGLRAWALASGPACTRALW